MTNLIKPASISRRGALMGAGAVGLALGQTAPKRGGVLQIGTATGSTLASLDPTTYTDQESYLKGFTLGNTLVRLGEQNQPQPELATS